MTETAHGILLDLPILDLFDDDERLAMRQNEAYFIDKQWRDKHVDYKHIHRLHERKKKDESNTGMPHFNLMRGMINDFLGVILPNIPEIRLETARAVDPRLPEFERDLRTELLMENEEINNALVSRIMTDNHYRLHLDEALYHSAVYGSGIISRKTDYTYNPITNLDARELVRRIRSGDLDEQSETDLLRRSARITIRKLDVRQCFWEAGRAEVDEDMLRCSHVKWVDTLALVARFPEHEELIKSASATYIEPRPGLAPDPRSVDAWPRNTAIVTTWDLAPVTYNLLTGGEIEDFVMVRTEVAGRAVLRKDVITREGGEFEYDTEDKTVKYESVAGAIRLPFHPFYLMVADDHPYGFSMIDNQELAEDAFNRIIAITMKYADRSLENAKIGILQGKAGEGDAERLRRGLKDPNQDVIEIRGNNLYDEDEDIRKIVQPLGGVVPQPPPMLMQVGSMLLQNFQRTSSTLDRTAIARARSAAGKRTEIAASDRPLIMPIERIINAIETLWEAGYEEVQALYGDREDTETVTTGGGAQQVLLNQEVTELLPVIGEDGLPVTNDLLVTEDNPDGVQYYPAYFVVNSTQMPMRATSEDRAGLPIEPVTKAQLLSLWRSLNMVVDATVRRLGLPKQVRDIDDMERRKLEQQQEQLDALGRLLGQGQEGEEGEQSQVNGALNQLGMGGKADLQTGSNGVSQQEVTPQSNAVANQF